MFKFYHLFSISLLLSNSPVFALKNSSEFTSILTKISTSSSENSIHRYLKRLKRIVNDNQGIKHEIALLIKQNEEWMDVSKWIAQRKNEIADPNWQIPSTPECLTIEQSSPFYYLACFYEARNLTWQAIEGMDKTSLDKTAITRAKFLFSMLSKNWQGNKLIKMYLGEQFPIRKIYNDDPKAPVWANLQRQGLERMTDIIDWWIKYRFRSDKSYGGGLGDDCEMWRWWTPILLAFKNPKIEKAQVDFSNMMFKQPYLSEGYYKKEILTDVEHSAEDLSDALMPLMLLYPQDKTVQAKSLKLISLMRDLWTGINKKGLLQFKSTYFSSKEFSTDPKLACDTVYHPRAIQPALLYWQRTGDEEVGKLILNWLKTWVDAAKSTDRHKPAGILPSAIHWPDGKPGGIDEEWWNPKNHTEEELYEWPSAMESMLTTLVLAYGMTGSDIYLEPLQSMAKIRKDFSNKKEIVANKGTLAWCAQDMEFLDEPISKLINFSGSQKFVEYLNKKGVSDYMKWRIYRNDKKLTEALLENVEALKYNFEMFTSEVRFTDRVLSFNKIFRKGVMMHDYPIEGVKRPNPELLYAMATGDSGSPEYFPLNAVRWHTSSRNIAAVVANAAKNTFSAQLWNFNKKSRSFDMELLRLQPGSYKLIINEKVKRINLTESQNKYRISIPSRKLTKIDIIQIKD
jgi:hypothetical protein